MKALLERRRARIDFTLSSLPRRRSKTAGLWLAYMFASICDPFCIAAELHWRAAITGPDAILRL